MQNPTIFPAHETTFMLKGPVGALEVKTAEPKEQEAFQVTVICCHPHPLHGGTMENKVVTTVFRTFYNIGSRVIRFNYRGVGKSEGEYANAIGETEDLLAIIHWVQSVRPQDQIWLAGFSFGAHVAYRAANEVEVQQLITIAPPVHHFDFEGMNIPKSPWLVVQGTADEVVPPQDVFAWISSLTKPPKLIKFEGVGHFFHGQLLKLRDILVSNYQDILKKQKHKLNVPDL